MRWLVGRAFLVLLTTALLAACGDQVPTYRYRLKVEVVTPEGVKSGSSVIEVKTRMVRSGSDPSAQAVRWSVRGEAVAVDLPGGRTLFALLRSPSDVEWAARVMLQLSPSYQGEPFAEQFDNMMELTDEITLRKYFPRKVLGHWQPAYPMLVTFSDVADPTSVMRVDPENLAEMFGKGFSLKRITVQITDAPVTTGINKRLEWLDHIREMGVGVNDFPQNVPLGDFTGMFSKGVSK